MLPREAKEAKVEETTPPSTNRIKNPSTWPPHSPSKSEEDIDDDEDNDDMEKFGPKKKYDDGEYSS